MSKTRICGSLAAAVVGDCIGGLFEGGPPKPVSSVLKCVHKFETEWEENKQRKAKGKKPKTLEKLEFTDDTAMARSIAASLAIHNAVDVKDIAQRFGKEYKKEPGRGYGGNVIKVLNSLADPDLKDIFQPAKELFEGAGSCGNGSAMRIAPLGLFCCNIPLAKLKEYAEVISSLTHTHPDALVGAVLESYAVRLALSADKSKPLNANDFLQQLSDDLQPFEKDIYSRYDSARRGESDAHFGVTTRDSQQPYCSKLDVIKDFISRDDVTTEDVCRYLGTNVSALGSVPTAIYCFLRGARGDIVGIANRSAVEQTILFAISLGGDTDTIATMAAAISGAFYGLDSIPLCWQDCCEGVDKAIEDGEKMAELIGNNKC